MAEYKNPLAKRKEELSEHVLVSHFICVLVVFLAVTAFRIEYKLGQNLIINFHFYFLSTILILILTVPPYLLREFSPWPWIGEAFLLAVLFPLIIFLIYMTQGFAGYKVLLFIPIVIASGSYGKTTGVICAITASITIFLLDFKRIMGHQVSYTFELDLVQVGIMVTLAWLIGGLTDIERRTQLQLISLANSDSLTGLISHRHFQEKLAQETEIAWKNSTTFALLIMDIDYFKFYNDIHGHQEGDIVLSRIGKILQELVLVPSFAARYGGDEFAVILPGAGREEARQMAKQISEKLKILNIDGVDTQPGGKIGLSFGISCFPEDGEKPKDLVKVADDACYQSRYRGGRLYFSVIDQMYSLSRSENDLVDCFKALLTVINAKDRYTFGHSERVMAYSLYVADKMELSGKQKTELRYGAYLHDVGKVEVEEEILNKEGPLLKNEWEIMKQHPVWGSDIVRPLVSLPGIVSLVRHHHENYDGSGYPDGLKGNDIPLTAKIMRIVDSFDAMTTDRPYKKGMTFNEACAELQRYAGSIYDPEIVPIFIETIMEKEIKPSGNTGKKDCRLGL